MTLRNNGVDGRQRAAKKKAATIASDVHERVKSGDVPSGSMLEWAVRENPLFGMVPQDRRERTPAEDAVYAELIQLPKGAFGKRTRELKRALRWGDAIDRRVLSFLQENPTIDFTRFIELAADRLLHDLGE